MLEMYAIASACLNSWDWKSMKISESKALFVDLQKIWDV
jgi:hypothetical protein